MSTACQRWRDRRDSYRPAGEVAPERHVLRVGWRDKFFARVDRGPDNGPPDMCWLWLGSKLPTGYGRFYPAWRHAYYAHRFSWELEHRQDVPAGLHVCHTCDNPSCVRPSHLFVGTRSENMQDMLRKGRAGDTGVQGERHPAHRLTEQQVRTIRGLATTGIRHRTIAQQFGVTRSLVSQVVRREAWSHVP